MSEDRCQPEPRWVGGASGSADGGEKQLIRFVFGGGGGEHVSCEAWRPAGERAFAHLLSMNTSAILTRSFPMSFACTVPRDVKDESRQSRRRRTRNLTASAEKRRCLDNREKGEKGRGAFFRFPATEQRGAARSGLNSARAAHLLGRGHVLGLRLGLHRGEGLREAVRLQVRLDGGNQVGLVHGGGGGWFSTGGAADTRAQLAWCLLPRLLRVTCARSREGDATVSGRAVEWVGGVARRSNGRCRARGKRGERRLS